MKLQTVNRVLTSFALIAVGMSTTINQPSLAESPRFSCDISFDEKGEVPETIGHTASGKEIVIIRWVDNAYFPPPWTPKQRCKIVSKRFQDLSDSGILKFIKGGNVNNETVLCGVANRNDSCTPDTVLITLKRGSNADITAQRLMAVGRGSSNEPLNENACKENCLVIDVAELLNSAPERESDSPNPQQLDNPSEEGNAKPNEQNRLW